MNPIPLPTDPFELAALPNFNTDAYGLIFNDLIRQVGYLPARALVGFAAELWQIDFDARRIHEHNFNTPGGA